MRCFRCDNLHKSNEVSFNRVSVRYKESNKEGRYVLTNEELSICVWLEWGEKTVMSYVSSTRNVSPCCYKIVTATTPQNGSCAYRLWSKNTCLIVVLTRNLHITRVKRGWDFKSICRYSNQEIKDKKPIIQTWLCAIITHPEKEKHLIYQAYSSLLCAWMWNFLICTQANGTLHTNQPPPNTKL